jgi:octanoyl-[GcvH]:protein N-octanoyltransferase
VTPSGVARWEIRDEGPAGSPAASVARDAELLEAVRRGAPPVARVWENARCLVAARSDARLPRFAEAAEAMARAGWPVCVRESGGTTIPQGPGILSLTLVFRPPPGAPFTIEAGYDAVCRPIERALAALGLASARGAVGAAFCDGRFDLSIGGRKIAGTAQRWRAVPGGPNPERGAVLLHAVLLADPDRSEGIGAVNRFYERAGSERHADPAASITLREAWAERGDPRAADPPHAVVGAFRAALGDALRADGDCA